MLPTDCEFGPDGAFYWSDWIERLGQAEQGPHLPRHRPEAMKNPAVAEAKKLLAEGFEKKSDRGAGEAAGAPAPAGAAGSAVRAGVARSRKTRSTAFAKVLKDSKNRLARLHAIWGWDDRAKHDDGRA